MFTPPTNHDYKPTHSSPPAEYTAASEACDAAWSEYYAYTDQVFDNRDATQTTPAEWGRLNELMAAANAAEAAKEEVYREWMLSYMHPYRGEPSERQEVTEIFYTA